jgi:hypothetical protein
MYWAIGTNVCSALRADAKYLPCQAVMQPVKMLSMVLLYNFLKAHDKYFQPPEVEEALS